MAEPMILESFRIDFENGMKTAVKMFFQEYKFFHSKKAIWTNFIFQLRCELPTLIKYDIRISLPTCVWGIYMNNISSTQ